MKLFAAILAVGVLCASGLSASQFGTGFSISPKGYLVTCHHVIRNADRILVHTPQGTLLAKTVAIDPRNDLAIIKVERWDGSHLSLSSANSIRHACEVTAVGFPDPTILGRNPKISKGIISALSGVRDDPRYLQTSTPIQPGNSGGPLIAPSGQVIGVIAAGLNSIDRMSHGGYLPQSVNYAVKADLIYPLLENASIRLPWFGGRTRNSIKQVDRALSSIALIEASSAPMVAPRREAYPPFPAPAAPHRHSSPGLIATAGAPGTVRRTGFPPPGFR